MFAATPTPADESRWNQFVMGLPRQLWKKFRERRPSHPTLQPMPAIDSFAKLTTQTAAELLARNGIGLAGLEDIRKRLAAFGHRLKDDPEDIQHMLGNSPPNNAPPLNDDDRKRLGEIAAGKHASTMMLGSIADELEKIAKELPDQVGEKIMGQVVRIARLM